ncbi:Gfo/Idh/MocA family protein [Nocardia asteroides]|uniref:Gfo/Idh/MocA family protein n=1 Tax=Nocardia asteroides TaxID=1824 RepID=UPI00364E4D1E
MTEDPRPALRIGVLGAARIAPAAVIGPARRSPEATVTAVAARDRTRAEQFARKHGVERVFGDYQDLLDSPEVDAVYIPLPNGLHGRWTRAAVAAGKHVLCEKPFTANAEEAREIARLAADSGLVVMEAFHYRYHPLIRAAEEIVASGELGTLRRVETALSFPLPLFSDIRYDYDLAGGALMDAGCYAVHMARVLGGEDPEVVSARAKLHGDRRIDRAMSAELRFPSGHTGRVRCSMWSADVLRISATVVGDRGRMRLLNPVLPHAGHLLVVRSTAGTRLRRFPRRPSYDYQLDAFADAVLRGAPVPTTPDDAVTTMAVIDDIYRSAGLPLRVPR